MLEYLLLAYLCTRNLGAEDFQSVEKIICDGLNKPNSRKATETQLVDHDEIIDFVANVDGVITSGHIFLDIFNFTIIHIRRTISNFGLGSYGTMLDRFWQRCRRG